jgi:hypothetical protein
MLGEAALPLKWRNGCWRKVYWLSHFLTLSFLAVKRGSGRNYRPHTPLKILIRLCRRSSALGNRWAYSSEAVLQAVGGVLAVLRVIFVGDDRAA